MLRPKARTLQGFSLVEILVALAIMAVLAAMLYPALGGKIRDSRTSALLQTFTSLAQAAAEFKKGTTHYPGSLSLLTIAPTASSLDICGGALSTTPASLWRGPYMNRTVLSTGLPMGDAVIQNGLRRVSTTEVVMMIDAAGVESATVGDLEAQLDAGTADYTTGTIRATTGQIPATATSTLIPSSTAGTYNVSYAVPILGC